MFRSTTQPYLLLNFCGSWSASSMKEIAAYPTNPKLSNNDSLKLVWMFFENDSTDWLKVIKKYNLPAQDCFFVKDYHKMTQNFSSYINWLNDFPHYFLFNKGGECVNDDEVSFSKFNANGLLPSQDTDQIKKVSFDKNN